MSTKFYVGQKDYIAKLNEIDDLLQGVQGEPGQGVPVGGTTGQVLSKAGEADYATAWIAPPSGREILTASLTYYVRKDGSDGNTGLTDTAGGAFLTIQKAANMVMAVDFGGNPDLTAKIYIADGTYEESLTLYGLTSYSGNGVEIIGNLASPNNVVIYPQANVYWGISVRGALASWYVQGFHLNASRIPNYGAAIQSIYGGLLQLGVHNLTLWSGIYGYMAAYPGSMLTPAEYANVTITGACRSVAACDFGAYFNMQVGTLTLVNVVASTFISVYGGGRCTFYYVSKVGSATGKRFYVEVTGWLETYGGAQATFVPGSIAGTLESGAAYS